MKPYISLPYTVIFASLVNVFINNYYKKGLHVDEKQYLNRVQNDVTKSQKLTEILNFFFR